MSADRLAGCRFSVRVVGENPRQFKARSVGTDQNNVLQAHGHYLDPQGQPLGELVTVRGSDLINPTAPLPGDLFVAELNRIKALWFTRPNKMAAPVLGGGFSLRGRPTSVSRLYRGMSYPSSTSQALAAQLIYHSTRSDRDSEVGMNALYQWAGFWIPSLAETLRNREGLDFYTAAVREYARAWIQAPIPAANLAWIKAVLGNFDPPASV